MKYKLFTHTDLDGVACAIVAKFIFGKYIDIEFCDYSNVNGKVKKFIEDWVVEDYERIFITDISIEESVAEKIDKHFNNFILLDHHPTSTWMNKYNWCKVNVNCSLGRLFSTI
jgi:oligoribonuclease NrnB/cAMP/cGMP phosphodiesterase (DHH superfamily)